VGVVLPAYNCRQYLPPHLKAMREWTELVEEIVVVDSFSDDGTLDLLKEQLPLPHARFTSHPRGLYQSWNFGISQITAKYTYISTVGDVITREGLQHLAGVADQFQADVVLSPPRFVGPDGQTLSDWRWPIHRLIDGQAIRNPAHISSLHAFLMTVLVLPEGILGSSASNLYRTDLLKHRPFPTEYGHSGDTVWSLRHGLQTKFAVTPSVVSQFMMHAKAEVLDHEQTSRLTSSFVDLAIETCRAQKASELQALLELLRAETAGLRACQLRYDGWRKHSWPWILNPIAWRLRARRNQQRDRLQRLRADIPARFGLRPCRPETDRPVRPT